MLSRLLREPLVHFLVLGAALFAIYGLVAGAAPERPSGAVIVVDPAIETQLDRAFEATWRHPPDADEHQALIDQWLREEVLVREAVALGFDRDDPVIRQRLRQKMEFLIAAEAQAATPDDARLDAHLAAHPDRFARPAAVAFEQVFLGDAPSPDEIAGTLADLDGGADPAMAGRPTLLPGSLPLSSAPSVDGTFGSGFFRALEDLPLGIWAGPVASGYGLHLVRVTAHRQETLPPLAEIRDEVLRDWRADRAQELTDERVAALLARYTIQRAPPPDAAEAGR
ncbi:MAG: peptidyl-prolyl cis-trans isomerase [Rhodobacteraceae bacterium]|nr:peptidyl-prolyl cis-trans isomerase [Paracoccaceae bacterium]